MSGEKELWIAVLQDAIETATNKKNNKYRDNARKFITSSHEMFDLICQWLDYDADKIRERMVSKWE